MSELTRLLSLVADPPGPLSVPDPTAIVGLARRGHALRRGWQAAGLAGALAAVVLPFALLGGGPAVRPVVPVTVPATPAGTVDALAAARWGRLPEAPVPGRSGAASAWTGRELVVWGGSRGRGELRADGAAYDPAARTWQVLPAAPLRPVDQPLSVWTGSRLLVLGGQDGQGRTLQQLASYDPTARRWQRLELPAERAVDSSSAVSWTGHELLVVGTGEDGRDASAYDPERDAWRTVARPPVPEGHDVERRVAVTTTDGVLVLSSYVQTLSSTPTSFSGRAGVDVLVLDVVDDTWSTAQDGTPPTGLRPPLHTVRAVLVPAAPDTCVGSCPAQRGLRGWALTAGRWSRLPAGPVDDLGGVAVWTGSALLVANTSAYVGGPGGERLPGEAAALDLRTGVWRALPAAPASAYGGAVAWTGEELLVWGELAEVDGTPDDGTTVVRSGGLVLRPS